MLHIIITLTLISLSIFSGVIHLPMTGDYVRKVILNEQFITPPEESDVGWTGMFHHFRIEKSGDATMLRLKGNAIRSDTSWLATSVSLYHGEWNYTIHMSGDPSNSNRIDLVVMSDTVDLKSNFNGYLLKAGDNGSNDVIRLMRVDKGVLTPIVSGTTPIANGGTYRVRLIRDPIGQWALYMATADGPFELQGAVADNTFGNLKYSGFRVIYTRTRNSDYAIGPIQILQTPPQLLHAELTVANTIRCVIDSNIDPRSSVRLSSNGNMVSTRATINNNVLEFELENPITPGSNSLLVSGLSTGNGAFVDVTASFELVVEAVVNNGDILINEYMYRPPEDVPQFVELVNVSLNRINLKGWELRDYGSGNRAITTSDLWIEPGKYVVLTPDSVTISAYYSAPNVRNMTRFPSLNRGSKDGVILRTASGVIIDSLGYTPTPTGDGVSIERVSLQAPTWAPTNWKPSVHRRGATPGEPNSVPPEEPTTLTLDLVILNNPNTITLSFSSEINIASISSASINGIRIPFSQCSTIDYKAVHCTSAAVFPIDPDKPSLVEIEGARNLLGITLPVMSSYISWLPTKGDLLINEILFNPLQTRYDGGSDQSHFVELINTRNHHVFIADLQLKTTSSSGTSTSTITFSEKNASIVNPKSILVLHADTATTAMSRLSQFFGLIDDTIYLRANRSTLSLNSTSGSVWVHASNQVAIDSIVYDAAYHYPSVRDRRGVSLERISVNGLSLDQRNWGSYAGLLGGSPGLPNSIVFGTQPTAESAVEIYPNPFSPDNDGYEDVTSIRLTMPDPGWLTKVEIFDRFGRKVRTLANGQRMGSTHEIYWNGLDDNNRRVFTGFYIVLVEAWHVEQRKSLVNKKVIGLIHQPRAGVSFK